MFGLARKPRLFEEIEAELAQAEAEAAVTGKPARRLRDFRYATLDSWSRRRRVIGKAEWTKGEANPRFIVTPLKQGEMHGCFLYETIHCARGDMENSSIENVALVFAAEDGRGPAAAKAAAATPDRRSSQQFTIPILSNQRNWLHETPESTPRHFGKDRPEERLEAPIG